MSLVAGVAMVKDEADVIAGTLAHMADEVDLLLVADNGSTDGTRELLDELTHTLPVPLYVSDDPEVGYYQSRKMTALAAYAAQLGAKWIVPFDADELWYARAGRLREVLPDLTYPVATATLCNHIRTSLDVDDPDPFASMVWRLREANRLSKVAFRWQDGAVIHPGNHGVTLPTGEPGGLAVLDVCHFPIRSLAHLINKARNGAAAYAATDLHETYGAHWRSYGALLAAGGEDVMRAVYEQHWYHLSPIDGGLVHDPAPYLRWPRG